MAKRRNSSRRKSSEARSRQRRLKQRKSGSLNLEALEARQLLAGVTVGNTLDVVNAPDTSSISALVANDGGDGISLREAITAANNTSGADTISFDAGVFNGEAADVIRLQSGELPITESLTINGGTTGVVISGDKNGDDTLESVGFITNVSASNTAGTLSDNSRVLNFSGTSGDLNLNGVTVTGGSTTAAYNSGGSGGGIAFGSTTGTLTIDNSNVSGNAVTFATAAGGGIYSDGTVVVQNGSHVSGNRGGGIVAGGDVTVTNSTVSGNNARSGGGIGTNSSKITLSNSTVSGNNARSGGGIATQSGDVTIRYSSVTNNTSDYSGGGILARGGSVEITRSQVTGNMAGSRGGGVNSYGTLFVNRSTISDNTTATNGGGIWSNTGRLIVQDSTIRTNEANINGGGIYSITGPVNIDRSTISGNTASNNGGGIYLPAVDGVVSAIIDNSTISGNVAARGGGFSTIGRTITVSLNNSTITGNRATNGPGGGFNLLSFYVGPKLNLNNSIVAGNTDNGTAPDIEEGNSDLTVRWSLIGDTTGAGTIDTAFGNILDQPALLGPLANNGGPTETHALLPGSPAIDAANTTIPSDQRNAIRPFDVATVGNANNGSDIGAFELQTPVFTSTATVSVPEGSTVVQSLTAFDRDVPAQTISYRLLGRIPAGDLGSGQSLLVNQTLTSPDGTAELRLQGDGNLVIRDSGTLTWATGTENQGVVTADFNGNNLVLKNSAGDTVKTISFGSGTDSLRSLHVTNEGQLHVRRVDGAPIWRSSTGSTTSGGVVSTLTSLPSQFAVAADNSRFQITGGNLLEFLGAPDFENPTDANGNNVYEVNVLADDGNGGVTPQTIMVTVTPTNDNSPIFTSPATASIAENTRAVHTLTATDADLPAQTVDFRMIEIPAGDLGPDQSLGIDQPLSSPDGTAELRLQGDGNLVLRDSGTVTWATGTETQGVVRATIQANGNLELLDANDNVVFQTNSAATADSQARLHVTDEGQLVVLRIDGARLWESISNNGSGLGTVLTPHPLVSGFAPAADNGQFQIISNQLEFRAVPDFEIPTDADGDNVYEVSVFADDGNGRTTPQTILVTVTDLNENLVVTTTDDTVNSGDGVTSLREAILTANGQPGATTVAFDAALAGTTITLGSELLLTSDITIVGDTNGDEKADITISGNNANRIFRITGAGTDVDLHSLTVTDGLAAGTSVNFGGGAVLAELNTTLDVLNSTVQNSVAPGGATGLGGGISSLGTLQVVNSTLTENSAGGQRGGGLFVNGMATLTNTTIDGNTAGGGVRVNTGSTLTLNNSTVTSNTGDGISFAAGTSSLVSNNSVIALNSGVSVAEDAVSGQITAGSSFFGSTVTLDTDLGNNLGVTTSGDDPLLAALTDNGGPVKTRAIQAGSQLIDAGDNAVLPTESALGIDVDGDGAIESTAISVDARGPAFDRVRAGRVDIGAFEIQNQAPVFTSPTTATVSENTQAIQTLTATDVDVPAQTITFSIAGSGADNAKFELVSGSQLQFIAAPDFENPTDANGDNVYEVSVQADDGNGGVTLQTILVTVTPVNDNSPVFTSPTNANVAENTQAVHTLTATDADSPAQTITFSISGSGADNNKFEVVSGNQLQFIAAPDFESPTDANGDNVYEVTIQADDGNGGVTPQTILVTVTNVNEPLVFTSPTTASVVENTQAVHEMMAFDPDGHTPTFNIFGFGDDIDKFEIVNGNQLQFKVAPDFENPTDANGDNVYEVGVEAEVPGDIIFHLVHVTVTDVNEPLVFTSPTTASVVENTQAVHELMAFDPDGHTPNFSIFGFGDDIDKFEVVNGNQLQFKVAPDFENPTDANGDNVYEVGVEAEVPGDIIFHLVHVTVTDVNETPVFTSPPMANVAENTQAVHTLTASDEDLPAQTITFSITGAGADNDKFELSGGNELRFIAPPDFENPADANSDNVYEVSIQADDGNGGVTPQTILVTVTDVDDSLTVTTTADSVVTDGLTSLREAIIFANSRTGADTITFDPSVFTGGAASLIRLGGSELIVSESLTIDGSTGTDILVTADANNDDVTFAATDITDAFNNTNTSDNSRVLRFIGTTDDLTLRRLTLTGGNSDEGGAIGFYSNGLITLEDSVVSGNNVTGEFANGGGIYTTSGAVTLNNSTVSGNQSGAEGGGIYTSSGDVTLNSSTVSGNRATGERFGKGGGIYTDTGALTLYNTTVSGNSSYGAGGGIMTNYGAVTVNSSAVSGNQSGEEGGGIYTDAGAVTLNSSTVSGNNSGDDGGGIYTASGAVTLDNSTVSENVATGYSSGGGIFASDGRVSLSSSTVSGNQSGYHGGGISASDGGVTLTNSTVSGNQSGNDGGGIYASFGTVALTNSTVSGNSSGDDGGGIEADTVELANSTVAGNIASGDGGGIAVSSSSGSLALTNSIVAGNLQNGLASDIKMPIGATGTVTASFSLIGTNAGTDLVEAQTPDANGNLIGSTSGGGVIDPMLAPLANNGGPTMTHALLPGSPALNAGDPSAVAGQNGVPEFDQRGMGFGRVSNGRIDVGSFEVQPLVCAVPGDLDCSGQVGGNDLDLVLANWGVDSSSAGVPTGWVHDLPNGVIGGEELDNVLANWGNSSPMSSGITFLSNSGDRRKEASDDKSSETDTIDASLVLFADESPTTK